MYKSMTAIMLAGAMSLGACSSYDNDGDDTLQSAGTGAAIGAAAGAGLGAVVGGINPLEGAVVGAVVGGLAGAIWADRDNDGRTDGYYQNGTYYEGAPPAAGAYQAPPAPVYQAPPPVVRRSGERG